MGAAFMRLPGCVFITIPTKTLALVFDISHFRIPLVPRLHGSQLSPLVESVIYNSARRLGVDELGFTMPTNQGNLF